MDFARRSDRERALVQIGRVIDRLVREGTAVAASDGSVHTLFPVAVSIAEAEALQGWIIREGAVHTIEIGLGYAISALFVCAGLCSNGDPTARHVVIDPNQTARFANCGLQFLEEAGLSELVEFYAEESQIVLPRFLSDGRRLTLRSSTGTTASTACSSTWSTLGDSCVQAGSSSSTTTSSRPSPGQLCSS